MAIWLKFTARILALGALGTLRSFLPDAASAEVAVAQFERWQHTFSAEEETDAQRLELLVDLTGPDGAQQTVRGFWDGDATWRVRFMPTETGRWNFKTRSTPVVPGLDGVEGSFECAANVGGTPFLEHGPVGVSDEKTYLAHRDGTPFFWLVDTAWNGALFSSADDWEIFLQDRAGKRFTGVKFVMTQWRTARANAEGEVAYTGFEDIEINPDFFRRMDARVDAVNAQGLLAVPVLLWTLGDAEENPGQLPESEAVRLARYMVARYQANHVMFFLPGDGNYSGENAARWKRIGGQVFDLPGHPPAMLHPQGMHWPYSEWKDVEWVSVEAYQSGHGDDSATLRWIFDGPPAKEWSDPPLRPVINVEPPYEDHVAYQSRKPHTAYTVRRALYWSLLNAPTAGVSYGAHGVWSWQREPGEPLNHQGSGVAKSWREAMTLPGSEDVARLYELFTSTEWWRLRPARELVDSTEESPVRTTPTHVVYTRDASGDAAIYVDGALQGRGRVEGDFSNWSDDYRLALGDEMAGERPWKGGYLNVAIYGRAMRPTEVEQRFEHRTRDAAAGAVAAYDFAEGTGTAVRDVSGHDEPLDLHISDLDAVEWLGGSGLRLRAPARIASERPAEKIVCSVTESGAITIEAWIAPDDAVQAGPARIVTLSEDHVNRNFTLGQEGDAYEVRLRTSATSPNGLPALQTAIGAEAHVAAARSSDGNLAVIYLPLGGEVRVNVEHLSDNLEARWFDPRTGSFRMATGREDGRFRAPDGEQDWVLWFSRR